MATLGSPLFVTLCGLLLVYVYAWLRGVAGGESALLSALLLSSVVGPSTLNGRTLSDVQPLPLFALAALQFWLAWRNGASIRWLLAAIAAIAALSAALRDTAFLAWQGAIPAHLLLAAVLTIGAIRDDSVARLLRRAGAVLLGAPSLLVLASQAWFLADVPRWGPIGYVALMATVAALYGRILSHRWYLVTAAVDGLAAGVLAVLSIAPELRSFSLSRGSKLVLWGLGSFAVAVAISAFKGRRR